MSTALENAGFGLQFADVSVGKEGERYGSTIPVTSVQGSENPPAKEVPAQAVSTTVETPHASVRAASVETPKTPQLASMAVQTTHAKVESESVVQSQNVAASLPVSGGKSGAGRTSLPAGGSCAETYIRGKFASCPQSTG